jgi:hypothetical protein
LTKFAEELANGTLVIDPLTGKAIPNPDLVVPVPNESLTPDPEPSSSETVTP